MTKYYPGPDYGSDDPLQKPQWLRRTYSEFVISKGAWLDWDLWFFDWHLYHFQVPWADWAIGDWLEFATDVLIDIANVPLRAAQGLIASIGEGVDFATDWLADIWLSIFGPEGVLTNLGPVIATAIQGWWDGVWGWVSGWVGDFVTDAMTSIKQWAAPLLAVGQTAYDRVTAFLADPWGTLYPTVVSPLLDTITDRVSPFWPIKSWVEAARDELDRFRIDPSGYIMGKLEDLAEHQAERFLDVLGRVLGRAW